MKLRRAVLPSLYVTDDEKIRAVRALPETAAARASREQLEDVLGRKRPPRTDGGGNGPDSLRAILVEILTETERPDKIRVSLDPVTRSLTIVYEDLDDEWFREVAAQVAVAVEPLDYSASNATRRHGAAPGMVRCKSCGAADVAYGATACICGGVLRPERDA